MVILNKTDVIDQALLSIFDKIYTGRASDAFQMFIIVNQIDPDNEIALLLKDVLVSVQMGQPVPEGVFYYFGDGWLGEDLSGKSIQIYCDQGMGDILNLLCFVKQMKDRWGCKIVLNCYAHYEQMKPLIHLFSFVDEFSQLPIKCDYHTNLMSIPSILATGHVQYPALFTEIMERDLPQQISLDVPEQLLHSDNRMKVGVVFSTNTENEVLCADKSFSAELLKDLPYRLISLSPSQKVDFIETPNINNLWDTATLIKHMDVVVSVDTVVLHLAGLMGKTTIGLLHTMADPRWGDQNVSKWYRTVTLLRQEVAGDWSAPIKNLKNILASLNSLKSALDEFNI